LGLLLLHVGYYLVLLPRLSPEHALLERQWSLAWVLSGSVILAAYGPTMILAVAELRRCGFAAILLRPETRFALLWFAAAFVLANHELFVAPRQPLHFTRGYVWTPLALLALPLVRDLFRRLLNASSRMLYTTVALGLLLFATLDNAAWFGRYYAGLLTHRQVNAVLLTADQQAILRRLSEPDMHDRLVLSNDETLGYLVTVYIPLRAWLSHGYNTPDAVTRRRELATFFATGTLIAPWQSRRLVAIVDTSSDPDAVARLQASGFVSVDRRGKEFVLLRDPR
jgi:hypothetical protein